MIVSLTPAFLSDPISNLIKNEQPRKHIRGCFLRHSSSATHLEDALHFFFYHPSAMVKSICRFLNRQEVAVEIYAFINLGIRVIINDEYLGWVYK